MNKAQVALEFIMFSILALFIALLLIGLGMRLTLQELDKQATQEAQDLANSIQEELIIATQVQLGYHRVLNIPIKLRTGDYELTNDNTSLTITKSGVSITIKTPLTNGTLQKGRNVIIHEQETITISN